MAPTDQKIDSFPVLLPGFPVPNRAEGEFYGFYAANADTHTFSSPSQVVLDRTDEKTITGKAFHRDMFNQQVKKADMRAVFTEYAWDMNWCDPCAADPLSHEEPLSLGVFWLTETPPALVPGRGPRPIMPPMGGARDVFVTPLHMRHEAQDLPERPMLRENGDLTGWQLTDIDPKINLRTAETSNYGKWWQKLWTS